MTQHDLWKKLINAAVDLQPPFQPEDIETFEDGFITLKNGELWMLRFELMPNEEPEKEDEEKDDLPMDWEPDYDRQPRTQKPFGREPIEKPL